MFRIPQLSASRRKPFCYLSRQLTRGLFRFQDFHADMRAARQRRGARLPSVVREYVLPDHRTVLQVGGVVEPVRFL